MVDKFINSLTGKTAIAYQNDLAHFVEWNGSEDFSNLTISELMDYSSHLTGEFAASTVNRKLSALRSYIRWLVMRGDIPAEVYSNIQAIKGPKIPHTLRLPFSPAEVDRLLNAPNLSTFAGVRDYAVLSFVYGTGVRLDEVVRLDMSDIHFDQAFVIVNGKGDKQRIVILTDDTAASLVYYLNQRSHPLDNDSPVFVNADGGRLSHRYVQKMMREYGEKAGILNCHPHRLRRTFAVDVVDATGDIHTAAKLLGHSDIRTTEIYAEMAVGNLRNAAGQVARHRERKTSNAYRANVQQSLSPVRARVPEE